MLFSKRFLFVVGLVTTVVPGVQSDTIRDIACGDAQFSVACSLIDSCAAPSSSSSDEASASSSHDAADVHTDTQNPDFEEACVDLGITTVEECGAYSKTFCSTYGVDDMYMSTFHYEAGDSGPKYCVVKCTEGKTRWEICGTKIDDYAHPEDYELPSMEECGNCKGDCADADSDSTPSGPCKNNCMETFGWEACPCGNDRCSEDWKTVSHSHDDSSSSDEDVTHEDTRIPDFEEACDDLGITTVEECGAYTTTFCSTYGVEDKYISTFHYESGDSGPKYCVVKCTEGKTRWEVCGTSSGDYASGQHGDIVPSDEDFTHEDTKIPDFEDACDDLGITTVEECGSYSTTFCNTYGVDDVYMSTFHYEAGDSGPKYCVVKCTEGKTRWEVCGTKIDDYAHPEGHGDSVPSDEDFTHEDQQIPDFEDACDDLGITTVEECGSYSTTFCNTYGVDDVYMSTFHYESGDSGPKYCVVKCTEGKARWEVCGTSSGDYSHADPELDSSHDSSNAADGGGVGACYDMTVHKCSCDPGSCTAESCNSKPDHTWTDTCPNHCDPSECSTHEDQQIPDFEDACDDLGITTVEECGTYSTTFCNTYGVDEMYMSTFHYESGDSGPKYCVAKCTEGKARWEVCGTSSGDYAHPEGHGDSVPSDEDFTHEDQQIPDFEDACDDLGITTVEECGAYSTTFCNTYGVDEMYMSTFHYESGDSGPKYCVAKCTEGKARWEVCGTSSGDYAHPEGHGDSVPSDEDFTHEDQQIPDFEDACDDLGITTVEECGAYSTTFCNTYGVDDVYMSTFHYESGDSGPKYCVVKCTEGKARWEVCGTSSGDFTHSDPELSASHDFSSSSDNAARRDRVRRRILQEASASSSSDDSHTHGHDATELAGTHYEDTRQCADCKGSCESDTPEFVETEDGVGCKSQCHTAYDPFCTCGGQVCGDGFEGAEGPYTVFLPTDAAFAELDSAVGGLANVDTDVLCGILEFHVVAEKALSSSDLSCGTGDATLIEMANGVNTRVKCTKDVPYGIKGGGNEKAANFVDVDIQASDGYVHVIDNVLFYPAVLDSPFGQTTGGENVVPSFRGSLP